MAYAKRGEGTRPLQPDRTPHKAVELVRGDKKEGGCRDHEEESDPASAKGTVQPGIAHGKQEPQDGDRRDAQILGLGHCGLQRDAGQSRFQSV